VIDVQKAADEFASTVSTEGRVLVDMHVGGRTYSRLTDVVRVSFLEGFRTVFQFGLFFPVFSHKNAERCRATFGELSDRAPEWWSNAMAGESGEACNITKKMSRIRLGKGDTWNKPKDQDMHQLIERLKREIGDVVIYADLFASSVGLTLEDCVRTAFNEKSDEIGSPVKL
jgi:hypothetical protein